ncbi:unnamed protein product [Pylaiella littoralis]
MMSAFQVRQNNYSLLYIPVRLAFRQPHVEVHHECSLFRHDAPWITERMSAEFTCHLSDSGRTIEFTAGAHLRYSCCEIHQTCHTCDSPWAGRTTAGCLHKINTTRAPGINLPAFCHACIHRISLDRPEHLLVTHNFCVELSQNMQCSLPHR